MLPYIKTPETGSQLTPMLSLRLQKNTREL